jgi:hypothetical protein
MSWRCADVEDDDYTSVYIYIKKANVPGEWIIYNTGPDKYDKKL